MSARADGHAPATSPRDLRRRGSVLLLGGAAVLLLVRPLGPLDQFWNPLLAGLAFLAAAASTGRRSPLWGAGLVVASWGLAQLVAGPLDLPRSPLATVMLGVGGLVAAFLAGRGFAVSAASVAAPAVFLGLGQYLSGRYPGSLVTFWTAGLVLLWGVVELANATRARAGQHRPVRR